MAGRTVRFQSDIGVRVEGLAALNRALREFDPDLRKEVTKANKDAAEMIRRKATARGLSQGSVAAKAAAHLKSTATMASAAVVLDGYRYPYALGAEFGGHRRRRTRTYPGWTGSTYQFKPWLGKTGYWLYPTIRDEAEGIVEPYKEALDNVIAKTFPYPIA